jgi:hypothetical protein
MLAFFGLMRTRAVLEEFRTRSVETRPRARRKRAVQA